MEHTASRLPSDTLGAGADTSVRPATPHDASTVHALYEATPEYFRIISIPTPTLEEVRQELIAAHSDPRRFTELVLSKGASLAPEVVGYLDYKMHYPQEGDVMVNLLLISAQLQSRGLGRNCVRELESRLQGRAKRVLASIYGQNPRAEQFWKSLGYEFAIDAKPVLDWYAKAL